MRERRKRLRRQGPQHVGQDAAVAEVFQLVEGIDPAGQRHLPLRAVGGGDLRGQRLARFQLTGQPLDRHRLVALKAQRLPGFLALEDQATGGQVLASELGLRRARAAELGKRGAWFWMLFWLVALVVVLWPNSTVLFAQKLGIGRGTDVVLYVSVALVFFLLFKLHIKIESIGRDVTRVVREHALQETLEKKK